MGVAPNLTLGQSRSLVSRPAPAAAAHHLHAAPCLPNCVAAKLVSTCAVSSSVWAAVCVHLYPASSAKHTQAQNVHFGAKNSEMIKSTFVYKSSIFFCYNTVLTNMS